MPRSTTDRAAPDRTNARPPTPRPSIVGALSARVDTTEHRRYLARGLDGVILDLGAGNGAMIPYLRTAAERGRPLDLHAVEPAPDRRTRAKRTAAAHGLDLQVASGRAESLPYGDATFDVVIAAAVFCTVQHPALALAEVHRVLQPDGEFRFFEHVRADGLRGAVQDAVTPLWTRVDDGCHLDRRTDDLLDAGPFVLEEIEHVRFGVYPVRPFVRGTATPVRHPGTASRTDRKAFDAPAPGRAARDDASGSGPDR